MLLKFAGLVGFCVICLIPSFVVTEVMALRRPGDIEPQKSVSDELVGAELDAIALGNIREFVEDFVSRLTFCY